MPLRSKVINLPEFAFVLLRYSLGGDRPNQTTSHKLSNILSKIKSLGWYYTNAFYSSHLSYTKHSILQLKIIVKVYRVFPSNCEKPAFSRALQFHQTCTGDSRELITPFMQDGTYPSRNFATFGPSELQPPFTGG
jgi:hypothetical protein